MTTPTTTTTTPVESSRVVDRFFARYHTNTPADFNFLSTDGVIFGAHKAIVTAASSTMEKMVNGTDGLAAADVINLRSCNADDFEQVNTPNRCFKYFVVPVTNPFIKMRVQVMNHLYNKDVVLTPDNVKPIMMEASYLELLALELQCANYFANFLTPDNLCESFSLVYHLDHKIIEERYISKFQTTFDTLLKRPELYALESAAFERIFKYPLFLEKEAHIYEAFIDWAEKECHTQSLVKTAENMRKILGNRMKAIRFCLMSLDEFFQCLQYYDIFDQNEVGTIVKHIASGNPCAKAEGNTHIFQCNMVPRINLKHAILKAKYLGKPERKFTTACSKILLQLSFKKNAYITGFTDSAATKIVRITINNKEIAFSKVGDNYVFLDTYFVSQYTNIIMLLDYAFDYILDLCDLHVFDNAICKSSTPHIKLQDHHHQTMELEVYHD